MSPCRGSTVCFLFLYSCLPCWVLIRAATSSSSSCPTIRSTVLPLCGLLVHRLACGHTRHNPLSQRYSSTSTSSSSLALRFTLPSCSKCPCGQRYPLGSSCHPNFSLPYFSS